MKTMNWMFALVSAAALAACGGSQVPHERMTASEKLIRAAEEVGAKDVPTAALHLQLAKEQTDQARALIKSGHNERARMLLIRADADAELAVVLAKEDAVKTDAMNAMEEVKALQNGQPVVR